MHYHIELTRLKSISSCERELSRFRFMQAFVLRCLIILIVLDSSIAVEWSRILKQFLHEILEYSFNVEIIWINWFQMLNCLFTSIFLAQSELPIFLWVLLMTLSSTDICSHYCWNWALISELHSTYWLFSLNIRREVSRWILFIASWRVCFFSTKIWLMFRESWLAKSLEWRLLKVNKWTIKKLNSFSIEDLDNLYILSESDILQCILLIIQRDNANNKKMIMNKWEIVFFVARRSFKYNDVIDSKIVNLDIWYHFRLLNESSREFEFWFDSRLISSRVMRLISSIRVESRHWYQVLERVRK